MARREWEWEPDSATQCSLHDFGCERGVGIAWDGLETGAKRRRADQPGNASAHGGRAAEKATARGRGRKGSEYATHSVAVLPPVPPFTWLGSPFRSVGLSSSSKMHKCSSVAPDGLSTGSSKNCPSELRKRLAYPHTQELAVGDPQRLVCNLQHSVAAWSQSLTPPRSGQACVAQRSNGVAAAVTFRVRFSGWRERQNEGYQAQAGNRALNGSPLLCNQDGG